MQPILTRGLFFVKIKNTTKCMKAILVHNILWTLMDFLFLVEKKVSEILFEEKNRFKHLKIKGIIGYGLEVIGRKN